MSLFITFTFSSKNLQNMTPALENRIEQYFSRNKKLSKDDLLDAISRDFPELNRATITVYLSKFKRQGLLANPSRGVYAIAQRAIFTPEISKALSKLYKVIHRALPYVDCCISDTRWLNEFMRHQTFKQYTVVEVERVALSQVFNILSAGSPNVYMDPPTVIFDLYIVHSAHAIILRPLTSEAPTVDQDGIVIPTIEKLMVDMLADKDLYAAQQGELNDIYNIAFQKFQINCAKMNRYALRRNRADALNNLLRNVDAK